MILRTIRRLLDLPPRRCGSWLEPEWVPMRDGTRLFAAHVWPIDLGEPAPSILIRTPYGVDVRGGRAIPIARLLAEIGYHVVVQDVRGRYQSEGEFTPFEHEQRDGGDTLEWLAAQSWCDGRIGLFGVSYLAYCAWAALAERPGRVSAVAAALGSGDLYETFYPGGAFALSVALEWGLGVGRRERVPGRRIDLERGLRHRPTREADRVALRTVDWYRDWIDHPRSDAFWQALRPALPERPPPTLIVAGWYDFFLSSQLGDYAAVLGTTRRAGAPSPRLVVGPWAHGMPARLRWWREGFHGAALRESLAHFDAHLHGAERGPRRDAIRYFVPGAEHWRREESWPPEKSESLNLYLRGEGLELEPPGEDEGPDRYPNDPEDPLPTCGGALFGLNGGAKDQRALGRRADRLVYQTAELTEDIEIAGEVGLELYASSSACDVDFTAKLVDVDERGRAINVCDGITRCGWLAAEDEAGEPEPIEPEQVIHLRVALGATAWRFRAGHRVRLEVGSANFPRFDRNPGSGRLPARAETDEFASAQQSVHRDSKRPSHLVIPVVRR